MSFLEIYEKEIPQIKYDEGFEPKKYKDSLKKPTQGYGTLLPLTDIELRQVKNPDKWTKAEALVLLKLRLGQAVAELVVKKPIVNSLTKNRQLVLTNMVYQHGVNGLLLFKKMWAALEERDYGKAADEMKDSKWYGQTQARAKRLINRMLEG
jgi:lysozyme